MNGTSGKLGALVRAKVVAIALIVVTLIASACSGGGGGVTGTIGSGALTPRADSVYQFKVRGSSIEASAPATNTSGNLRVAFWHTNVQATTDQQSCIDWLTPDGRAQPGLALRIVPKNGPVDAKAIVLTQNLWGGALGTFFVLGMEGGVASSDEQLGYFTVGEAVVTTSKTFRRGPWHVCARAIGSDYRIKVWVGADPEPSWSATHGVWRVKLPALWVYPGLSGAYVGHILPGKTMGFANLRTTDLSKGS